MSDNSLPEPTEELPQRKKMGRPSVFSQQIADEICERLAHGETLRTMILDDHMPAQKSIYRWLQDDENFRDTGFQFNDKTNSGQVTRCPV